MEHSSTAVVAPLSAIPASSFWVATLLGVVWLTAYFPRYGLMAKGALESLRRRFFKIQ